MTAGQLRKNSIVWCQHVATKPNPEITEIGNTQNEYLIAKLEWVVTKKPVYITGVDDASPRSAMGVDFWLLQGHVFTV